MKYRIEQIISYLDENQDSYSFYIREYASPRGEYSNEAVILDTLVSESIGVIIEFNPFNPTIYYTLTEVKTIFKRLEAKTLRIRSLLQRATDNFNSHVGTRNKKES